MNLLIKTQAVIDSCKTLEQMITAFEYLKRASQDSAYVNHKLMLNTFDRKVQELRHD